MKGLQQGLQVTGFLAVALLAAPFAHANLTPITIIGDPSAPLGNFQTPGTTSTTGYTITVSDDGTNLNVIEQTTEAGGLTFANLYFDTIASTPNTGSNLGFEFGPNSATNDAFIPGVPGSNTLVGTTGATASFTTDGSGQITADITIANSFFLNDPLGMGFVTTPPGTLVSLHLSQSFGYSVVGGGSNYPAPVELGDAVVDTATPEPGFYGMLGVGIAGLVAVRRKIRA